MQFGELNQASTIILGVSCETRHGLYKFYPNVNIVSLERSTQTADNPALRDRSVAETIWIPDVKTAFRIITSCLSNI